MKTFLWGHVRTDFFFNLNLCLRVQTWFQRVWVLRSLEVQICVYVCVCVTWRGRKAGLSCTTLKKTQKSESYQMWSSRQTDWMFISLQAPPPVFWWLTAVKHVLNTQTLEDNGTGPSFILVSTVMQTPLSQFEWCAAYFLPAVPEHWLPSLKRAVEDCDHLVLSCTVRDEVVFYAYCI